MSDRNVLRWLDRLDAPDVAHGTYGAYINGGCRCDECKAAWSAYTRKNRNTPCTFVDADPVRERWLKLRELGMTDDEIERAAGIDDKVSDALFRGHWRTGKPVKRMKRANAERIMAVRRRALKPRNTIPSKEARRMVLDLMGLGYSQRWIAEQINSCSANFRVMSKRRIRASTHAAIYALWARTTEPRQADTHAERSAVTRAKNQAKRWQHRAAA